MDENVIQELNEEEVSQDNVDITTAKHEEQITQNTVSNNFMTDETNDIKKKYPERDQKNKLKDIANSGFMMILCSSFLAAFLFAAVLMLFFAKLPPLLYWCVTIYALFAPLCIMIIQWRLIVIIRSQDKKSTYAQYSLIGM